MKNRISKLLLLFLDESKNKNDLKVYYLNILMDTEYPKIDDYLNILDNEYKIALFYKEFRVGKHVYSKKYLYGFDMTDDTRMLWTEISPKTIMNDISHFLDTNMKYYVRNTNTSKEDLLKLLKSTNKMSSDGRLKGIYNRYEAEIIDDKFMETLNRTKPHHLPIMKCNKIDLRDGSISPLSKVDNFTYSCPVQYTKDRPVELMNMLKAIACNKDEDLKYIQKMLGYGLTGHIDSRVYFILFGKGCNGKSVLLNLMSKILCAQYQAVSKCVFINNNTGKTGGTELLQLKDCRMATYSETNANDELNEAIMKMLSGNDAITARGLYKDPMTFIPICKIILCTNYKPDFNANDKANVDRVRLVPLNARFVDTPTKPNEFLRINGIDKIIETKYLNEFFSWCVDGAIEYYKNPDFTPVGEMLDAQNEYIREQANINNFIDDMFDEASDSNIVMKSEIKAMYDVWCKENGIKPLKMSALYSALDDKFGKSFKYQHKGELKNKWVYKGLSHKLEE
jgi:P4 family phage/plasmid primase-like protien